MDANYAFRLAFGAQPPAGIRELRVSGLFVGRQSDKDIYFQFRADRAAIQTLLASRAFGRDDKLEAWLRDAEDWRWRDAWRSVFGSASTDAWVPAILARPSAVEVFRWYADDDGPLTTLTLLWDAVSGRAYARYVFG